MREHHHVEALVFGRGDQDRNGRQDMAKKKRKTKPIRKRARAPLSKVVYVRPTPKKQKKGKKGKPAGAKTKLPTKASMRAIIEELVVERRKTVKQAWLDGVTSGPQFAHHYLKPMLEHIDGKPDANLNLNAQFKSDEVAAAQRNLARKLDSLKRAIAVGAAVLDDDTDDAAGTEDEHQRSGAAGDDSGNTAES